MPSLQNQRSLRYRLSGVGFTVLETTIVAAMLSLMAAIILPTINTVQPTKLDYAAAEMAAAFRYARAESIRTTYPYGVRTQTAARRLTVVRAAGGATPATPVYDVYQPISKQLYRIDVPMLTSDRGVGVTQGINWSSSCNDPEFVYFDAQGRPHCADPWGVLLIDYTLTLSWSGHVRRVDLAGETGRVTVQ